MQHIVSLSGDCNMQRTPVNAGSVEWSGENPGIYLKENPDGDYSVVAIFQDRLITTRAGRWRHYTW